MNRRKFVKTFVVFGISTPALSLQYFDDYSLNQLKNNSYLQELSDKEKKVTLIDCHDICKKASIEFNSNEIVVTSNNDKLIAWNLDNGKMVLKWIHSQGKRSNVLFIPNTLLNSEDESQKKFTVKDNYSLLRKILNTNRNQ